MSPPPLAPLFTAGWSALLAAGIALECAALLRQAKGDTLSEHVWRLFSVAANGRWAVARRCTLVAIMAALGAHFVAPGWIW